MNSQDYVIVNKKELEKELKDLKDIRNSGYSTKGLNYDKHYIDAKIYSIESLFSNSKPLQPLLEEIFEESRRQHDWAGGHIYGEEETEDLTDWKYPNFEKFIKDKQI